MQSSRPAKGNSLHKNTSYDLYIVKIRPPVSLHSSPFYPTPKSGALRCFQSARHPQKCSFPWGIYTPCNTCSQDPPHSVSQAASRFSTAHSRGSLHLSYLILSYLYRNTGPTPWTSRSKLLHLPPSDKISLISMSPSGGRIRY